MKRLSENLFLFEDTCNVYAIRTGSEAVLVDFGSGAVLDRLSEIGVERVTDVLMTHHHRDQGQGLPRAVENGIRIWVPHTEQDLFAQVDAHWQARELYNNYNNRQDRFSLLESVPIDGTLQDYETRRFGGHEFTVVPTPGHTTGSITLMGEIDGAQVAFTGDLIAAPGQVWSMAATQWSYNGAEGAPASIASLLDLKDRQPDVLLPSHGEPMRDPASAIDPLVERLWRLLQLRGENPRLFELRDRPYEPVTPHLLFHRASVANTYVLISESKKALVFDFGYDFITGIPAGSDRASRRPWLYTIPTLKRKFGVERIDVVLPTHYHDDHVAGVNLLRRVEGTQVWAAELFADILEHPANDDLPCLWFDPFPVDRMLPLETAIEWEEYALTLHHLPGHTYYAVAVALEVDGQRVLVTGDQYAGENGLELNYVYQNRFQTSDYVKSADLYRRLAPDIILSGHWAPLHVPPTYLDQIDVRGTELEGLHRELLAQSFHQDEEGSLVRLTPYQISAKASEPFDVRAEIRNPYQHAADVTVQLAVPEGWRVAEDSAKLSVRLDAAGVGAVDFHIFPSGAPVRRARISVDITIDGKRFGQQAEALVTAESDT